MGGCEGLAAGSELNSHKNTTANVLQPAQRHFKLIKEDWLRKQVYGFKILFSFADCKSTICILQPDINPAAVRIHIGEGILALMFQMW